MRFARKKLGILRFWRAALPLACVLPLCLAGCPDPPDGGGNGGNGGDGNGGGVVVPDFDGLGEGLTAEGWTALNPSPDSRMVYVSASEGDDDNDGLSPDTPVQTLQAGIQLLRNQMPDWLLLRRGDTWMNEDFGVWSKGGRSAEEPMVIASYGEGPRPLITNNSPRVWTFGHRVHDVEFLAVTEIHSRGMRTEDGTTSGGFFVHGPMNGFLVEDCVIENHSLGVSMSALAGPTTNVAFRRNIIVDNYIANSGRAQGVFIKEARAITIEENVIDYNGWRENVSAATVFNQNVYLQNDTGEIRFRRNIVMRGSAHGLQTRAGGIVEDNLFVRNSVGVTYSGSPAEEDGRVVNNVVLNCNDVAAIKHGWGINIQNLNNALFDGNIVAHEESDGPGRSFILTGDATNGTRGLVELTLQNNIVFNGGNGLDFRGHNATPQENFDHVVVMDNVLATEHDKFLVQLLWIDEEVTPDRITFSGNTYASTMANPEPFILAGVGAFTVAEWTEMFGEEDASAGPANFVDPERSPAAYMGTLGMAETFDAFVEAIRNRPAGVWDEALTAEAVNAYIREGFELGGK